MQLLTDLRSNFRIYAVCVPCQRMEPVDFDPAIERLGPTGTVEDLRHLLRCGHCRARTHDLRIVYVGPEHRPATFHYRR